MATKCKSVAKEKKEEDKITDQQIEYLTDLILQRGNHNIKKALPNSEDGFGELY